jgi:hypothetical protein
MADLTEKQDSRRVTITNDKITITMLYFGAKANFAAGAEGWACTVPTSKTITVGSALSDLAAATGMTFTGYDAPLCVYVDKIPRWTKGKGFIRAVYVGEAAWVA